MKVNWKVRFKNPVFLLTFITAVVAFIYQILGLFEIVPKVSEDQIINIVTMVVNLFATLGILVDPTTKGITDSERALGYIEPQ